MENLTIVSKVKRYIKDKSGNSTSGNFFEKLNQDIHQACLDAANKAKSGGRKTVMGRDFNYYVDEPKVDEQLVVASKVKKLIKEETELSTSSQAFSQLTLRVQKICDLAIENTTRDKRKTVMDRDFSAPHSSLS